MFVECPNRVSRRFRVLLARFFPLLDPPLRDEPSRRSHFPPHRRHLEVPRRVRVTNPPRERDASTRGQETIFSMRKYLYSYV